LKKNVYDFYASVADSRAASSRHKRILLKYAFDIDVYNDDSELSRFMNLHILRQLKSTVISKRSHYQKKIRTPIVAQFFSPHNRNNCKRLHYNNNNCKRLYYNVITHIIL